MTAGSAMQATTRTSPPQPSQVARSSWNTRFSRCAQVMARWRSAGVRVSVVGWPLPRPAGVICARHRLWGAKTMWVVPSR
ncbi:MAG: hypothetical protein JNK40_05235 [Chromatiales bacterium]|nr:hypothetical protein [Chromatiales bacterium]